MRKRERDYHKTNATREIYVPIAARGASQNGLEYVFCEQRAPLNKEGKNVERIFMAENFIPFAVSPSFFFIDFFPFFQRLAN